MSKDHQHDHHAGHQHGHHHGHHHGEPTQQGRAFAIAIVLNSVFVTLEFVYGYLANSTALVADAGHNLSTGTSRLLASSFFWSSLTPHLLGRH
jgi:cobalt-zinc-cadmium efflux system protein